VVQVNFVEPHLQQFRLAIGHLSFQRVYSISDGLPLWCCWGS